MEESTLCAGSHSITSFVSLTAVFLSSLSVAVCKPAFAGTGYHLGASYLLLISSCLPVPTEYTAQKILIWVPFLDFGKNFSGAPGSKACVLLSLYLLALAASLLCLKGRAYQSWGHSGPWWDQEHKAWEALRSLFLPLPAGRVKQMLLLEAGIKSP